MPEHSKTVRGTFDNPKTKPLLQKGNDPSRLGDPVSLRSEKTAGNSNSSTPRSASGDPYRQNEGAKGARKVNPTQLGDPASLTAETSGTELGRDVESVGAEGSKGGKSKL